MSSIITAPSFFLIHRVTHLTHRGLLTTQRNSLTFLKEIWGWGSKGSFIFPLWLLQTSWWQTEESKGEKVKIPLPSPLSSNLVKLTSSHPGKTLRYVHMNFWCSHLHTHLTWANAFSASSMQGCWHLRDKFSDLHPCYIIWSKERSWSFREAFP